MTAWKGPKWVDYWQKSAVPVQTARTDLRSHALARDLQLPILLPTTALDPELLEITWIWCPAPEPIRPRRPGLVSICLTSLVAVVMITWLARSGDAHPSASTRALQWAAALDTTLGHLADELHDSRLLVHPTARRGQLAATGERSGLTLAHVRDARGQVDSPAWWSRQHERMTIAYELAAATITTAEPEPAPAPGEHWRLETEQGPVHVWRPPGYRHESAGIVVYVHGFHTDVDDAWSNHRLAEQFLASQQNALFIVPEARAALRDAPRWRSLSALLRAVCKQTRVKRPRGHLVVAGHSGAYRAIARWLAYREIDHIILIDALYGHEERFRYWLGRAAKRMTVVASDTRDSAEPFARRYRGAHRLDHIPDSFADFAKAERSAKLLYMRSQYGHMEMVTNGAVLPMLLRTTYLQRLGASDQGAEPARTHRRDAVVVANR